MLRVDCKYQSCCQQGIIQLNSNSENERRFLVFGGVHGDFTNQTFIFVENLKDLKKSTVQEASEDQTISFNDKFYFQFQTKLSQIPPSLNIRSIDKTSRKLANKHPIHYSENLVAYRGRRGLYVFDLEVEKWLFISRRKGYMYEDIYH